MPFANYQQNNLAQGALDAGISASATTIVLESGQGDLFPTVFPFEVLIQQFDGEKRPIKNEIAKCTNRVSDTLTVVRADDYVPASFSATSQTATAFAFDAGSTVTCVLTAKQQKDVQDEIARLETDKLDKAGGAKRTGLTPKRVIITDGSGNETELSGASWQVVGFDGSGTPIATTPSTDINGLSAVTQLSANDAFIIYEDGVAENRKILQSDVDSEISKGLFGSGSDGSLSVTTGTTSLTATGGYVIKQYENLTVTGGTLDVQGEFNFLYVRGTFTMSGGAISVNGRGGAG